MAKSLTSILSQIERLQKEAAAIQLEVVARIRKDIAKYGLTAEQLFGATATGTNRARIGTRKTANVTKAVKAPKYADGAGNTWGGMGKRPDWLRQALAAGRALEDFLVGKAGGAAPAASRPAKAPNAKAKAAARRKAPIARRAPAKPATAAKARKARAKASTAAEAG